MRIQSFINSAPINAISKSTSATAAKITLKKNPFTLEALHEVENCEVLHAVQAIQGANKAFSQWKLSSVPDRITLLNNIIRVLTEQKSEFAKLEATDQGLPQHFISDHSVQAAIDAFIDAKTELEQFTPQNGIYFSPVGVISIIASWNLSVRVICERLAPALAAGNAVLIKVSSQSPVTANILARILEAAAVPIGLVQVLISEDQDVKNLLVSHPGIKGISFIGQLKNAADILKLIASQSQNQFKKIQIASGSKNTAVVLTDPNDSQFQDIIDSFMLGQGQLSWNSNRLFILEKFEKEWEQKIQSFFSEIQPAKSSDDKSSWGPCLKPESFSHFSEIESVALSDQAKLIQPQFKLSSQQQQMFLRPTFTKDMSNCSTLQQDQVMAPLFILSVVKYPFDIAKYSNVSYYGQSAHIWAPDEKIEKIAEQLEVAQVFKNTWSVKQHRPNRGVKQSGFGLQDYRVFGDFFSSVKIMT